MISVYARRYEPTAVSGLPSPGTDEALLFTIPVQNGKRPFLTARVNNEMGNAGSFEFSIDPGHPYADIWLHMRTLVRVDYDGDTIFYGRVLTIDRDMFRTKTIHCEGTFTFFMDSVFEGKKEGFTVTLSEYLAMLIEAHNDCMKDAPHKKIFLGEAPGNYSSAITEDQKIPVDTQKYAASQGYRTVKEWLDDLVSDYAGTMRVRYNNSDGKMYLDWMKLYFNANLSNQTMSVNSNAIDLSDTVEVDNIFTHVIPVGKNNKYIDGSGGGGGGSGSGQYTVTCQTVPANISGKVWANPSNANEGTTIELHYTAYAGYVLQKWEAMCTPGIGTVTITGDKFTMPASDVIAIATFKEVPDEGILPV